MIPTSRLFDICDREGIVIEYHDIHPQLLGHYCRHNALGTPLITLHTSLRSEARERDLRCVLAEELGHHDTGCSNYLLAAHVHERALLSKNEYRALRWAVDKLVPEDRVITRAARYTVDEMADYFFVRREFVVLQLNRLYEALQARWNRDPRTAECDF